MGANATTTVPTYVNGEVLDAADLNITNSGIPVFATTTTRDAAFNGAGEKTLAQGQIAFIESTNGLQFYNGSAWILVGGSMVTKVDRFIASGTFTPPTGATYAVAHIRAAGGGNGITSLGGNGGDSSVAFAAGTITAIGGTQISHNPGPFQSAIAAGATNSGQGASGGVARSADYSMVLQAGDGALVVAGDAVTAGVGITVTIGAAGTAGGSGAAGGSGYVWIEYMVPA
jgi:hypothetical protein